MSPLGRAGQRLEDELNLARKEGIPVSIPDFRRDHPAVLGPNAAPAYQAVFRSFSGPNPETRHAFDVLAAGIGYEADPVARADMAKALRQVRGQLDTLIAASRIDHCDFDREWEKGAALAFPEYPDLRGSVKVLCNLAQMESFDGHPKQAMDHLLAAARIARHAGAEPILIASLVQVASESIVEMSLQRVLTAHGVEPGVPEAGKQVIAAMGPPIDLRYALGGELAMGLTTIGQVANSPEGWSNVSGIGETGEPSTEQKFLTASMKFGPTRAAMTAHYVNYWRALMRDYPTDPTDILAASDQMKKSEVRLNADRSAMAGLTRLMAPVFSQSPQAAGKGLAQRRVMINLCDALIAKRSGAFPAALPAQGADSIDPFTKRPLRYVAARNSVKVYSVGPDLKDDDGRRRDTRSDPERSFDIVYEYPFKSPLTIRPYRALPMRRVAQLNPASTPAQ